MKTKKNLANTISAAFAAGMLFISAAYVQAQSGTFSSLAVTGNAGIGMTNPSFKIEVDDSSTGSGFVGRFQKNLGDGEYAGFLIGAGAYREGFILYADYNEDDAAFKNIGFGIGGDGAPGVSVFEGGRMVIGDGVNTPALDSSEARLQVWGGANLYGDVSIGSSDEQATLNVNGGGRFTGPVHLEPQGDLDMGEFTYDPNAQESMMSGSQNFPTGPATMGGAINNGIVSGLPEVSGTGRRFNGRNP